MEADQIKVSGLGWVLPGGVGTGPDLPDALCAAGDTLTDFSARPYLRSTKGYLDASGQYVLSAVALALGDARDRMSELPLNAVGVSTVTRYGATRSAYRFYEQFLQKGPRHASPLMFPHGYSNTPGNLAAIEFGFGGPHLVLYAAGAVVDAVDFAVNRLADGQTEHMLVAAYEALDAVTVADGVNVVNGSVAMWLTRAPDTPELFSFCWPPAAAAAGTAVGADDGSVTAMIALLQTLAE